MLVAQLTKTLFSSVGAAPCRSYGARVFCGVRVLPTCRTYRCWSRRWYHSIVSNGRKSL